MESTPEEIIKGLSAPITVHYHTDFEPRLTKRTMYDLEAMHANALTLIQQLEAERDAFKEALGLMVYQYCVRGDKLDHMYMCAGETAFRVLGLEQYGDTRTLESWLFPECQEEEP